jgi:hypothetical protein
MGGPDHVPAESPMIGDDGRLDLDAAASAVADIDEQWDNRGEDGRQFADEVMSGILEAAVAQVQDAGGDVGTFLRVLVDEDDLGTAMEAATAYDADAAFAAQAQEVAAEGHDADHFDRAGHRAQRRPRGVAACAGWGPGRSRRDLGGRSARQGPVAAARAVALAGG